MIQKHGLGLLPFFPLASGLLTGKYKRGAPLPAGTRLATTKRLAESVINERNWAIVEALRQFAAKRGHTMLELAMSWLASRALVSSIIAGATRPEQVEQNVAAVGWTLSAASRGSRSHHCLSDPAKNAAADSPARNLSLLAPFVSVILRCSARSGEPRRTTARALRPHPSRRALGAHLRMRTHT